MITITLNNTFEEVELEISEEPNSAIGNILRWISCSTPLSYASSKLNMTYGNGMSSVKISDKIDDVIKLLESVVRSIPDTNDYLLGKNMLYDFIHTLESYIANPNLTPGSKTVIEYDSNDIITYIIINNQ
jgi:hypothetical protein